MQKKITHMNKEAIINSMQNRSRTIGEYNFITYVVNSISTLHNKYMQTVILNLPKICDLIRCKKGEGDQYNRIKSL